MKLKRLLSGVLAAAVALSTMALTPFTTAFAEDNPYFKIFWESWNPSQKTIAEGTADASMAGATKVKISFEMGANAAYNPQTSLDVNAVIGANTTNKTSLKGKSWSAPKGEKGLSNTLTLSAPVAEGESYVIGASTKNWEKCTTEDNFVFGITKVEFIDDSGNVLKTHTAVIAESEPKVIDVFKYTFISGTGYNAYFVDNYIDIMKKAGTTELVFPSTYDDGTNGELIVRPLAIWNSTTKDSYVTSVVLGERTEISQNMFSDVESVRKVTFLNKEDNYNLNFRPFRGTTSPIKEIIIKATGLSDIHKDFFRGVQTTAKVYVANEDVKQFIINATSASSYKLDDPESQIIVGMPGKATVDFTKLDIALHSAKAYGSADYTEESYKALTDAVTKGNEVVANEKATQDEVDAAAKAINDAIKNLVELTVVTGSAGENVTWSLDKTTGILTISGTGPMYEGRTTGATTWTYSKYADKIKEAVIEEGVTSIGSTAFGSADHMDGTNAFPNLTKITMPSTIEKIEAGAFEYSNIENLTVPENVKDIGAMAYQGTKIENVKLNEGIGLGGNAFKNCNSLKEVTIPAGITYRRDSNWTGDNGSHYQFENCTALEKVTILGGGTVIQSYGTNENGLADGMFSGCSALKEVVVKCDNLAYVVKADSSSAYTNETFETIGTNITYTVIKGSTTETTLRDAGYITDENVVYSQDFTELNAKIAEAEAIDAELYTAESYAVLTSAIGAAKTVKANADATQDDINSAIKAINDAIEALVVENVDEIKASLEALTQKVEKLLTVKNEGDYTAESWKALSDALTAAKTALESEEQLSYKGYEKLNNDLSGAYTGLKSLSTAESEYVGTIYGGYEVTYNHETDSYKIVVSDDVDMKSVVGTAYVKVKCTPNEELKYQLSYGKFHIWNFLDGDQAYTGLKASEDNVFKYNLSIPDETAAFSLTGGTGWTKDTEVFYVKSVEFYNASDELLYTYSVGNVGEADVRNLKTAIENAEALDKSKYTEETVALLEWVLEDAKAILSDKSATKDDYRVRTSELDAAVKALEAIKVELADYTAVTKAILSFPTGVKFTEESVAVFNKAVEAVVYDLDITHQAEVDAWAKAIEEAVAGLEPVCVVDGGRVTGKIIVSDENDSTEMTVTAVFSDGTKKSVKATSMGTYALENLTFGEYTLTISGGKYVERTYKIKVEAGDNAQDVKLNPLGDINGDGKVSTADVGLANSHAKGVKTLTDYDFACGDVNSDRKISTADVGMINSQAKGVKALW